MAAPHREVDNVMKGIANGATGLVHAIAGGITGAGGTVSQALDVPFKKITGKEGPHNVVDRLLDGAMDTVVNVPVAGVKTLEIAGEGICRALDHPVEQLGIPPALEGGMMGKLPKLPFGEK